MKDSLPELPWNFDVIESAIPHRYPFLLVDRIVEVEKDQSIVGLKNISMSDPNLQGHFPGNPIYPGVLIIEGLAQAAALLGYASKGGKLETCLLTGVRNSKFKKPVIPGDVLEFHVQTKKVKRTFFWFEGIAKVNGEVVAEAELSAQMM